MKYLELGIKCEDIINVQAENHPDGVLSADGY